MSSGCGCKEVYRLVVRRYIGFLILLIPIYSSCIYLLFFAVASLLFVHLKKYFLFLLL